MSDDKALVVDTTDHTPPYEQIRQQITARVVQRSLPPGARLPSVRQLAADLGIAPGTVARAYRALEADGLINIRLRGGAHVVDAPMQHSDDAAERRLLDAAIDYVRAARLAGADDDALIRALNVALRVER